MTTPAYPWGWLAEALAPAFTVRYPWVDALRRAGATAEAVCLLVPEAAGALDGWGVWAEGVLEEVSPFAVAGPDGEALGAALGQLARVDEPCDGLAALLTAARRDAPHVYTRPLLVVDPTADCLRRLADLVAAQRAMSYPLVRPVVLARAAPPGWAGETVRFGLPEPVGDLHRIAPRLSRGRDFWSVAVLALTAVWEAGAAPALAEELWRQLTSDRLLTLRDGGFDAWLTRRLDAFAADAHWPTDVAVPAGLAFAPLRPADVDDRLWQAGAVAFGGGWYDLTPLRARTWAGTLTDPAGREAVTRRRLVNAPLARWLAAWAASVEESLRLFALRAGFATFQRFLAAEKPRRQGFGAASRWDEIAPSSPERAVQVADFGDLTRFAAAHAARRSDGDILMRCREARNEVVHQRTATARALYDIAAAVECLAGDGLI